MRIQIFVAAAVLLIGISVEIASAQICFVGTNAALSFDGVDDVAEVPYNPALSGFSDFTFEIWGRNLGVNVATNYGALISKWNFIGSGTGVIDYSWGLSNGPTTSVLGFSANGISVVSARVTFAGDGLWHHYAVTRVGSVVSLFADGTVIATNPNFSATIGSSSNVMPTRLGNSEANNMINSPWNGDLDEVRIWNVGRTPAQIQANMTNVLLGTQPGLVGYWRFDDGAFSASNQIVSDLSPTGANGVRGANTGTGIDDPIWTTTNIAPIFYPGGGSPIGQANSGTARLEINGIGVGTANGPFVVTGTPGGPLAFVWSGGPNQPCILLAGPLNVANTVSPFIGSIDIGTPCLVPSFSDVIVLFDGTTPPTSLFFTTTTAGTTSQIFTAPLGLPPGAFIAVQGLMGSAIGFPLQLTAAFQIVL